MKHISILLPLNARLGSVEGPRQLFDEVNNFLISQGREPAFQVQYVAAQKEISLPQSHCKLQADVLLQDLKQTDLVIIPAIDGDIDETLAQNADLLPWIVAQYEAGAEVACLCVGAFLLGQTGLLDGHKCSTHWMFAAKFREMFPAVNMQDDRIITDENRLYSSGGAYSFLHLILYLIEKYSGRQMAILASKIFAIEWDRTSQSPFTIFMGQKNHEDADVKKAQNFIEENFSDKIGVDDLAKHLAVGRRALERRFKKATNNTVGEYVQRVKMEAAKQSLETSRKTVNEVMYDVGYLDSKAFRSTFRKVTGMSPQEYKQRFRQEVLSA